MPERLIVTPLEARVIFFNDLFCGHGSKGVAWALHGSSYEQWYRPEGNSLKLEDIKRDAQRSQLFSDKVDEVLDTLTDRARKMIKLRFGFDGTGIKPLEEVGKEFGLTTKQRPSVIIAKVLRRLRYPPSRSMGLRQFLPTTDN